jgi:hypothetical protein
MLERYYNHLSMPLPRCEKKKTNHLSVMQQESERRRPAKRRRVKPIQMDREQIVIAAPTYQSWLQDPSALVSKRGGMIKVFN